MMPTFDEFFRALWGSDLSPFPWQAALAERACAGDWPEFLAVPTGSGKTACIDIAVFALATQAALPPDKRTAGRRIFFIVNRRVIVDEAYQRARAIANKLAANESGDPVIREIAEALRSLGPRRRSECPPLDCVQLRGAIYRDNRWARSLTQPTVVASTVDQVGSRLLFRGYGLSPGACPLHAALVANDSLLLLDEAHISRPFAQTLDWVGRFRRHSTGDGEHNVSRRTPFHFVQMTATPPVGAHSDTILRIGKADRTHHVLRPRLSGPKPARLVLADKVKGKNATTQLPRALFEQAEAIIKEKGPSSLAMLVNRVATAREVASLLSKKFGNERTSLMIGRMRPIDRDRLAEEVSPVLKTGGADPRRSGNGESNPVIVVATQCLEVGADYDFDALVTECASLDALRQRFGRLNRAGRDIEPSAVIVMRGDLVEQSEKKLDEAQAKGKPLDPIYGNAVSHTWNWLRSLGDYEVDFGIEAMDAHVARISPEKFAKLTSPTRDAPVLFPAYLDAWAQTSPRPAPDPDPAIFLHGPDAGQPEVQVCWRADLPEIEDESAWIQAVSLCPPSSSETLSVPTGLFRNWYFRKTDGRDESGDLLCERSDAADDRSEERVVRPRALLWRGLQDSAFLGDTASLRPGDTIVLPVSAGGWSLLGHLPNAPEDPADLPEDELPPNLALVDVGSEAFATSRDRAILRLHDALIPAFDGGESFRELLEWANDAESDWTKPEIRAALRAVAEDEALPPGLQAFREPIALLNELDFAYTRYADERGVVLVSRKRLGRAKTSLVSLADEDDFLSATDEPVSLADHLAHVTEKVDATLPHLPLAGYGKALLAAARLHDWGKLDERFQALLLRGNLYAAFARKEPLAKSPALSLTAREQIISRKRSGLPERFRHEMLSVHLATTAGGAEQLPDDSDLAKLTLHLIASHHGHARPFAPVVIDPDPPPIEAATLDAVAVPALSAEERGTLPIHRIDSGIADRFWQLTRRHGWWGLAYLEAAIRLADQQASEEESAGGTARPVKTESANS